MIYDVIIIGAGASGLFAGINLDKKLNKLILEKTTKPGTKVLLSGGERANVSNMNIDTEHDYFSQNKKFLLSVFSKFNQWDTMSFFSENGINLTEEDRGRLILESGNSKDLLELFLKKIKENNCEIKLDSEVIEIVPLSAFQASFPPGEKEKKVPSPLGGGLGGGIYQIKTKKQKYQSKNLIISSGGKSFFQTGTTGDGYNFAEEFGLNIIPTFPGLCGITTKKDLSELSGTSTNLNLKLIDNKTKKTIYSETGPLLFTHFGLSGPIIFNTSNAIGEYLANIGEKSLDNLKIELKFTIEYLPKKLIKFFDLTPPSIPPLQGEGSNTISLDLHSLRSWKEAKITTGGIDTNELDNHMQSKKYKGLYFIGEVVDVTGKTGGYNLQWAWNSAFVACQNIK